MIVNNKIVITTPSGLFEASAWITQGKSESSPPVPMSEHHHAFLRVTGDDPVVFGIWLHARMMSEASRYSWSRKWAVDLRVNGTEQGRFIGHSKPIALFRPSTGHGWFVYYPETSPYYPDLAPEYRDDAGRIVARFIFDKPRVQREPIAKAKTRYRPFAFTESLGGTIAEEGYCGQQIIETSENVTTPYSQGVEIEILLVHDHWHRPERVVYTTGPRPIR